MEWIAPEVVRVDQPFVGGERAMLEGWLGWQRSTLLHKCAGLTGKQLAQRAVPPSSLSLQGLIRHHADVERSWFRRRFRGESADPLYYRDDNWDLCFEDVEPARADAEYAQLVNEWALADDAVAGAALDDTFVHDKAGTMSLRWIYIHLIEEYARHNGHADFLRERIDGATGY
ncbi:MAG: DinB family protein [Nocardioidaceae bacterium]